MSTMGRVIVTPTEPQSFDWLLERFGRIASLLTIMAGGPIAPDQISITPAGSKTDVSVLVALRNPETCPFSDEHAFFLVERTLGIPVGEALSRWFAGFDAVNLPSRLAVDVLNDNGNTYMDFLGVMQALEGFHRGCYSGVYLEAKKFEEARSVVADSVPQAITGDHRTSFLTRIQYGNEYSLRKRMKELVEALPKNMQLAIVGKEGNLPGFWIDARNAYTHWSREGMEQVMQGAELYGATQRLKMLLRVSYLRLVGVTDGAIMEALQGMSEVGRRVAQLPRPSAPRSQTGPTAPLSASHELSPTSEYSREVLDQLDELVAAEPPGGQGQPGSDDEPPAAESPSTDGG
jgi:hypothetical protein